MQESVRVKLTDLYAWMNEYEVSELYGFVHRESGERVYLSPRNLQIMLLYVIRKQLGVCEMVRVDNNFIESADNEPGNQETFSIDSLVKLIDSEDCHGIYLNIEKSTWPDRHTLMVNEEIDLDCGVESAATNVIQSVLEYVQSYINSRVTIDTLSINSPKFLYAGKMPTYKFYRNLNDIVSSKIGTTIHYYNQEEYEAARIEIETEQKQRLFEHILCEYNEDEKYTFTPFDKFVRIFSQTPVNNDGVVYNSDFKQRSVKQKYFQSLDFYNWLSQQHYKVYLFDSEIPKCNLDQSFYTALCLAQQNLGIKVLLYNSNSYNSLLTELVNMPYADFYTRLRNAHGIYRPGTIRVLTENHGRSTIGLVKALDLNLSFCGIEAARISEYVKKDDETGYILAVDPHIVKDDTIEILTNKEFERYNASGVKIVPVNPFDVLLQFYGKALQPGEYVDQDFEEYLFAVCRLIDQLLLKYQGFTTIRNLACFKIFDDTKSDKARFYIGIGEFKPEILCDIIVLNDEGLLVQDCRYSGNVLDINWIDDLHITRFRGSVDSEANLGFQKKVQKIYRDAGVQFNEAACDLESAKIPEQKNISFFMSLIYGSALTTSVSLNQNIYSLTKEAEYLQQGESAVMHDSALAPIYFGLSLPRNYKAAQHLTPYLLEYTTSYGYRRIAPKDSPINVFGGIRLDHNANMWLYPQLFQQSARQIAEIEGDG